jgi:hypothetical protein
VDATNINLIIKIQVMGENNNIGVGFGVMILRNGKVLLGQRHMDPAKADSELHGE